MKKLILILTVFLFSITSYSQNAKYIKAMEKALVQLDSAKSGEDLQTLANTFERISLVEKEAWLPSYYQALCHMSLAGKYMKSDMAKCNAHLDKAQIALDEAKEKKGDVSEIMALQGFIYQGRIWENPQTMGAKYSPLSHEVLDEAIAANADNPRAYFLKGQNVFYTPAFWGGGAENAKPLLEIAQQKFETFSPASDLHPKWGKENLDWLLKQTISKQ